jgi:hypothetical protein
MGPRLVLGFATGLLLGLLTSLSPLIAIVAILAVLVGTLVGVGQRQDSSRTLLMAGTLVGAGAVLLFGAINTVAACRETDDFCGNANVWPLLAFAMVSVGVGILAAGAVAIRTNR